MEVKKNRSEKTPYVQVKQKKATKNLIQNNPCSSHHIHQRRVILRTPSNI